MRLHSENDTHKIEMNRLHQIVKTDKHSDNKLNKPKKKHWSKDTKKKVLALYAVGYDVKKIEELTKVPKASIYSWVNGDEVSKHDISDLVSRLSSTMADRVALKANRALSEAFKQEKIDQASHKDLVVTTGVLIDKWRLLSGMSTENVEVLVHRVDDMENMANRTLQEIKDLESQLTKAEKDALDEVIDV